MEDKSALRRRLKRERLVIPDAQRRVLDSAVLEHLTALPRLQSADTVLLYRSCRGETDTYGLFDWLIARGITAALPLCGDNGAMTFVPVQSLSQLHPGAYGIPEPDPGAPPVLTARSVCIVPGVAFTREGVRLGQGGGYYDRFLSAHEGLYTIGLCYEALLQPALPQEAHDRPVDAVVTEAGSYFR